MSTTIPANASRIAQPLPSGLKRFFEEVSAFFYVVTHVRSVVAQVEKMAKLHSEANAVEATDPARAARLRAQAARIDLT
jgi:hypothetical protein